MSRKVTINMSVKLILDINDDVDIIDALDNMEYNFLPDISQASVVDEEILDWSIVDSK